jgi:hypothetical protein
MKRMLPTAALALGFAVSLAAQPGSTPAPKTSSAQSDTHQMRDSDENITLNGCLKKNNSGGYWLTSAKLGSESMGHATAGTSGSEMSGTGASDREKPMSGRSAYTNIKTWNLEVGTKDYDQYVGHRVEVTGDPKETASKDQLKGTDKSKHETEARDIDVKSVRSIANSCS